METKLELYKKQFDTTLTHLNNAGLSPISARVRDVLRHWAGRFYSEGYFCDEAYATDVEKARGSLAKLLGASSHQIAFFTSTSLAICQVAFGLDLKSQDEVITFAHEYGSNLYPWREACSRAQAHLIEVPPGPAGSVSVDAIVHAMTDKTRVVAVSWVQFQNGALLDLRTLATICRSRDCLLVVDAIQGVGLFEIDFAGWGIDALCGGSHKWLASPVGVGYLAITDALRAKLRPLVVGAQSFGSCDDPTTERCVLKTDASRFEPGAKASMEIMALGAAVELILETGVATIGTEARRLAVLLREGLTGRGYRIICPHTPSENATDANLQQGSIVSFTGTAQAAYHSNDAIYQRLRAGGIHAVVRGSGVRLSPHAFNRDKDLEKALALLS